MKLPLSGSQTVGPYFGIGMDRLCTHAVPGEGGERLEIAGRLLDGNGAGIPDGVLELWQADAKGEYVSPAAGSPMETIGIARIKTGADGGFHFSTLKPGAVPYDETRMQAPHILVLVYMRGLLRNLVTRLYFPDEPANGADPVLQLIPETRRSTLIAERGEAPGKLRWDIVVRQPESMEREETVFFSW
jgi:protocatechuate 3,4-dioxygenase alpha subunit